MNKQTNKILIIIIIAIASSFNNASAKHTAVTAKGVRATFNYTR